VFPCVFDHEQLYSGFYKTRLEPTLQEPQRLLQLIGYEHVAGDRLFLVHGVPVQTVLINAAVDFFLAATECRVLASVVARVEHSTPVEVYWMRRANSGDEQLCVETLTLARKPLPFDTEKPAAELSTDRADREKEKRGSSPYDNLLPADDSLKTPQYGFVAQPTRAQGSDVQLSHTEDFRTEAQAPELYLSAFSTFRQPDVRPAATIFRHESLEVPPPLYSAAKYMPSAQLQNVSYGQGDEVEELAAILRNVDPRAMEDAARRQQIMSRLESYSASSSSSGNADRSPKFVARHVHSRKTELARTGWHCQKCTYYNENSGLVCEMCTEKKSNVDS